MYTIYIILWYIVLYYTPILQSLYARQGYIVPLTPAAVALIYLYSIHIYMI